MTKTIRFGAAGVAMFAALGMSSVAHADNADADATAEILQALQLDLTAGSLDFGTMIVDGNGTVALDAAGNRTCSANITCSGTTANPTFTAQGTADKDVTINLPTSVNLDHPSQTGALPQYRIELDSFTSDATLNTSGATPFYEINLGTGGSESFNVGGTINLDGTEEAGVYTGTFNVSVEYS